MLRYYTGSIFSRLLLTFFIFTPSSVFSNSTNLEYFKSLLFERVTVLEDYEGIYSLESLTLENFCCVRRKINRDLNSRICVLKYRQEVLVFDVETKAIIGKMSVYDGYNRGYAGNFIPSKESYLPELEMADGLLNWDKYIDPFKVPTNTPDKIKSDLKRIISGCTQEEFELLSERNDVCKFLIGLRTKKIFPNENEPPPATISSGTGVIIATNGYVLTNRHVVERKIYRWNEYPGKWEIVKNSIWNSRYVDVSTDIKCRINGVLYDAQPVHIENRCQLIIVGDTSYGSLEFNEDLILLKITNPQTNFQRVVFDTSRFVLGAEMYALGYPMSETLGSNMQYTNGYFSSKLNRIKSDNYLDDRTIEEEMLVLNMGVNPGNSGGGIFSKKNGNLRAIVTARPNDENIGVKTEGISFATQLNNVSQIVRFPCARFTTMNKKIKNDYNHPISDYWDDRSLTECERPTIIIRDKNYKPDIGIDQNQAATVQIFAK